FFFGVGPGETLIKSHDDVGAKSHLDLHALFGRDKVLTAIKVAAKLHALFSDLAKVVQREHLKPATVGEKRPVPPHEFVKPAHLLNELFAGAQMKMVSVAEHHLATKILKLMRREPFDRRLGSHRHKHRSLDNAMMSGEFSGPSLLKSGLHHKISN